MRHATVNRATGGPEDTCRDVLLATTDGSLRLTPVGRRGWSDEAHAARLARVWTATPVAP